MNENDSTLPPPPDRPVPVRVRRAMADRKIAGVAAGLARHFDVDVTLVRLAFVGLTFFGGSGIAVYLVAWLIMPTDEPRPAPATAPPVSPAAAPAADQNLAEPEPTDEPTGTGE